MFLSVLATDSHRPIDLHAQVAAKVLERSRQRRNFGRSTLRLFGQGGDEAVSARPGYEIDMPRLDVGVRRRALGQSESLFHELPRHRSRQEHPRRVTTYDRIIKIQHDYISL